MGMNVEPVELLRKGTNMAQAMIKYDMVNSKEWLCDTEGEVNTEGTRYANAVIRIHVNRCEVEALVDTGSNRTCISQRFYEKIKATGARMEEIPVSNIQVVSAVGTRSQRVKRQVLTELDIAGKKGKFICLVIPNLVYSVILGEDWLNESLGRIDYKNKEISFIWKGDKIRSEIRFNGEEEIIIGAIKELKGGEALDSEREEEREERRSIERVVDKTGLVEESKKQLFRILWNVKEVFRSSLGKTNIYEHSFDIQDYSEFAGPIYPVPLSQSKAVDEAIKQMLIDEVIEPSSSRYLSPLVVVGKKDNTVRLCLDARQANLRIAADYERPGPIEELIQGFEGKEWFSIIDLSSSFWQVPLRKQDRPFTAFSHKGRTYQFTRIPFGMKTSSAGLIRAVNRALGDETREFVTCYVDDLVVSSSNIESHLNHLEITLEKLRQAGFTIKLAKTEFCSNNITFLGHKIGKEGVCPESTNLARIANISSPRNLKQLRSFLGVCNYFRRFVPNYCQCIEPFRGLLRKGTRWEWTANQEEAFINMKKRFETPVVLAYPREDREFYLVTDGSDVGIAGVLYQEVEGEQRVISLASRNLSAAEKNFTVTEKELLSIVYCLTKFRRYLMGVKFTILTDHNSLTFIKTCKLNSSRMSRWILLIQEYEFQIQHIKGRENLVADFFSRNPTEQGGSEVISNKGEVFICVMGNNNERSRKLRFQSMGKEQEKEEEAKEIRRRLLEETEEEIICVRNRKFKLEHGLIMMEGKDKGWKVVVPKGMQEELITFYHEELGHYSANKVLAAIQENFVWRNMARIIRLSVSRCDLCQRTKHPNRYLEGPYQNVLREAPGELVCIDLYGPLIKSRYGYQYILVAVDAFSKLVKLYPLRKATSRSCLGKMKEYFREIGRPKQLLADNGTQFTSKLWIQGLREEEVKLLHSSVRYPQGNLCERWMKELGRLFRAYVSDKHNAWYSMLDRIEGWMNVVTNDSTGMTPWELHMGQKPVRKVARWLGLSTGEVIDRKVAIRLARENLEKAGNKRKRRTENKTVDKLSVGDEVLLRVPHVSSIEDKVSRKFFRVFEGPYRVLSKRGECAYQLIDRKDKVLGTFNIRSLKKYVR